MLSLLPSILFAQTPINIQIPVIETPVIEKTYITEYQQIRPLPGKLNEVLVFNSNSPEVVKTEGILLSTFPSNGKSTPNAHLDKSLQGRFDLFAHHIARPIESTKPLYQAIIVNNPTSKPITLKILQAVSYLTNPDAPFIELPPLVEDSFGRFFSGPGSRVMGDILRGVKQSLFPQEIIISPQSNQILFSLPITTSNARSTFMRLESNGPLYMANLAMYGIAETREIELNKQKEIDEIEPDSPPQLITTYREPNLQEWATLLIKGKLVEPRDLAPTPLDNPNSNQKIFGRVAGISVGSEWQAKIVDQSGKYELTIPEKGQAFAYPLSTVNAVTQGTKQVQSAPMLVRYNDTAYRAHGNYGVLYNLTLPLVNKTREKQTVTVAIQTPLKQEQYTDRLLFIEPVQGTVFFRGTIRVNYRDDQGLYKVKYFHLVQRQGQQGNPLITLNLSPGENRQVTLDFLYPPDATPPQVLTIKTLESAEW